MTGTPSPERGVVIMEVGSYDGLNGLRRSLTTSKE
jgi:hypothetical protein